MVTRVPAVAGVFYEENKEALQKQLKELWPAGETRTSETLAAMVPHAGYVFSGVTAAQVYASFVPADIYFLIGPNHRGQGAAVAISEAEHWETPLGKVPVAHELGKKLVQQLNFVHYDNRAHEQEHALEVQLPFLQMRQHAFSIVPLVLGTHHMGKLQALGEAIAQMIKNNSKKCMLLASSDMNHFASLVETRKIDQTALQPLLALDAEALMETVEEQDISMCGVGAAVVMIFAAKALGADHADLIHYSTSAEASGEDTRVVGYAGVRICRKKE